MVLAAMDQVRLQEAHRLRGTNPELLTSSCYLWLKNPSNLRPQDGQRLEYLEGLKLGVFAAYLLKGHFRQRWRRLTKEDAGGFVDGWLGSARNSGLGPMPQSASLLSTRRQGVLAYFEVTH
ncbi:MAG: transposase [candidate division KSB1 bacterium]|nr:transposase [candidate division KSB1 bacterium]MDZ7295337.1 transposase [candidate division KSB1 bacterium]MDZ7386245.1 transposase [candidate division KSB1 bacterium]MDZ7393853.1 transposase [candidate division KSB1 bacterium]